MPVGVAADALRPPVPTEDDHAGSHPSAAGPGGRRSPRAACAACSSSSASARQPATGSAARPARPAAGFPVTVSDRRRQDAPPGPAGRHRLALADRHRDALRDRRGQPGQGGRQRLGLPGDRRRSPSCRPIEPNVEAIAAYKPDLVIISNDLDGITAKLTALSIPVLDLPAAANLSGVYAEFTELGAATGHVGAGQAGGQQAAGGDQQDRRRRAQARHAADLLLRARDQPVLLGDGLDLRRQCAVAARHEEHRRRRNRAPPPRAATRSCRPSTSSRPTRTTSSWPTPAAPTAVRTPPPSAPGPAGRC